MDNNKLDIKKPFLFTGITATGTLTLGHYFGVIKHLVHLQEMYHIIVMIADLHALTTISSRKINYKEKTIDIACLLYSCGLKEENCTIFVQSEISEHLELMYYLSSYCSVGRLKNMIQYKEKVREQSDSEFSLLSYPVLMASDILLYDVDLVIVGDDQKQHLEFTSYLAEKFNSFHQNCLIVPSFKIPELGSRIMGLRNPEQKMSKSGNDYVSLLDSPNEVQRKFSKANTDSEGEIYYDQVKKPGISNLLVIYSCLKQCSISDAVNFFSDSSYDELKKITSTILNHELEKIQSLFQERRLIIDSILAKNNLFMKNKASEKMIIIKKKIGLWNQEQ